MFHHQFLQDPSDFQAAFDELVDYTSSAENWKQIKDELTERGVRSSFAILYLNLEICHCNFFAMECKAQDPVNYF